MSLWSATLLPTIKTVTRKFDDADDYQNSPHWRCCACALLRSDLTLQLPSLQTGLIRWSTRSSKLRRGVQQLWPLTTTQLAKTPSAQTTEIVAGVVMMGSRPTTPMTVFDTPFVLSGISDGHASGVQLALLAACCSIAISHAAANCLPVSGGRFGLGLRAKVD